MLLLAQVGSAWTRPFGYSFVADRSVGYRDMRRVDVHVCEPPTALDEGLRDELRWMFLLRGRALLGLVGEGLLTTLAIDEAPVTRWITEHRPGLRLDAVRARVVASGAALLPSGALSIAADLLAGLSLLHERRDGDAGPVLHGDPSLAAVILDADGRAFLDPLAAFRWGAAANPVPEALDGPVSARFQHLSPARICGDAPSVADEIFAIGSILGALLIGQPVFQGESEMVTLRKVMEADTGRFESLARHVPDAIVDVVRTAVHRRPDRRFPTARAFADALEAAADRSRLVLSPREVSRWLAALDV